MKKEQEKKVKIELKDGYFYTVNITQETENFIRGIDKFGNTVMFSLDSIRHIKPFPSPKENEK